MAILLNLVKQLELVTDAQDYGMLLPKIVAREELQGPLIIISSGSQEKRGGGE